MLLFSKTLGKDSLCDVNQDLKVSQVIQVGQKKKQPIQQMGFVEFVFLVLKQSASAFHKSNASTADFSCPSFKVQSHEVVILQLLSNL